MTSLYIVFVDADAFGDPFTGVNSQFNYGTTINNTTGQITLLGTCPSSTIGDFFTGTSFPQVVSADVTDDITTLYVQGGGILGVSWGDGYVIDKNFGPTDPHNFGICSGSSLGNFLYHDGSNGGTSYNIVSNDPSLMPYEIYLNRLS